MDDFSSADDIMGDDGEKLTYKVMKQHTRRYHPRFNSITLAASRKQFITIGFDPNDRLAVSPRRVP